MTTNTAGMAAAVAAVLCTAVYQIWAGSKQKELGAGSMQLMHQFQPHATCLLALMVASMEPVGLPGTPHTLAQGTILGYKYTPLAVAAILTSAVLGLLVSLSTFLVIAATSSVTFNVVRSGWCSKLARTWLEVREPLDEGLPQAGRICGAVMTGQHGLFLQVSSSPASVVEASPGFAGLACLWLMRAEPQRAARMSMPAHRT